VTLGGNQTVFTSHNAVTGYSAKTVKEN